MFIVRWARSARDELAALWIQAESERRQEITAAAHRIDQELETNPDGVGESRLGNERVAFFFPLGIRFDVDQEQSTVRVLQVWNYRQRR
jgi:hypothetical protein